MKKNILVTGGLGYIGSAVSYHLSKHTKNEIIILDRDKSRIKYNINNIKTYITDLKDEKKLQKIMEENNIKTIIHLASEINAAESEKKINKYAENITNCVNILKVAKRNNIEKIIFSSTAAVYGNYNKKVKEKDKEHPINFYGFTKLECEKIMKEYAKRSKINFIIFRYFNVAGNLKEIRYSRKTGDLFSKIIESVNNNKKFCIYGKDYNTKDGTPIRDYIHVEDIARAHKLALNYMKNNFEIINLGSGIGYSVLDIVNTFNTSGKNVNYTFCKKRKGDIEISVADIKKARRILKWAPEKSLKDIVKSLF